MTLQKKESSFLIFKRLADIEAKGKNVSLPFDHRGYLPSVRVLDNPFFNEIGVEKRPDGYYADICLASTMVKARAVFEEIFWDPELLNFKGVTLKPNFHLNSFRLGNFGYPSVVCDLATYIGFWKEQATLKRGNSLLVQQDEEGVLKVLSVLVQKEIISADSKKDIEKKALNKRHLNIVPEIRLSIKINTPNAFEFFDELSEKVEPLFARLHLKTIGENQGPWVKKKSFYANGLIHFHYRPYDLHERCYLTFENCYNDPAFVKMTESYPGQERWVAESRYISFASLDNLVEAAKKFGLKRGNLSPFGKAMEFNQRAINFVFNGVGWGSDETTSIESGHENEKDTKAYWDLVEKMKSNKDGDEKWKQISEKRREVDKEAKYDLRVFNVGQANCSSLIKNGRPIAFFDIGSGRKEPPSCLVSLMGEIHDGLFVISHCDTDHLSLENNFHQAFFDNFWLLPSPTIRNSYIEDLLQALKPFSSQFKMLLDNSINIYDPYQFDAVNVYQADPNQKDPNQSTPENAHCLLSEIVVNKTAFIPGDSLYKEYPKPFYPDILIIPHHACRLKKPTCFSEKMMLKDQGKAYLPVSEQGYGHPRYHPNREHYGLYSNGGYQLFRFKREGKLVYFNKTKTCKGPKDIQLIKDRDFYDFNLN